MLYKNYSKFLTGAVTATASTMLVGCGYHSQVKPGPLRSDKFEKGHHCDKNDECTSSFCDPKSNKCAENKKKHDLFNKGHPCQIGGECVSGFCNATSHKCDDKPNDDKAKPWDINHECKQADDCKSGFCDAKSSKCAEKPDPKPQNPLTKKKYLTAIFHISIFLKTLHFIIINLLKSLLFEIFKEQNKAIMNKLLVEKFINDQKLEKNLMQYAKD